MRPACFLLLIAVLFTGAVDLSAAAIPPATTTLRLKVDNVRSARGTIWVGIYEGEHDFLDRHKARLEHVRVDAEGAAYIELVGMVVGKRYAFGLFHDLNDNGDLDTNWLGLPAEPWGFTGEVRTRLRLPYFDEVAFRLSSTQSTTSVALRMI